MTSPFIVHGCFTHIIGGYLHIKFVKLLALCNVVFYFWETN